MARDKVFNFRIPQYLEDSILEFAEEHNLNKSAATRKLIQDGLKYNEEMNPPTKQDALIDEPISARVTEVLAAFGYEKISDIPHDKLDEVTEAVILAC